MGLLDNIYRFHYKECSDQRDRVYSLLAMSQEVGRLNVDYSIDMAQVARDVLWLYKEDVCVWRTLVVLQALQVSETLSEANGNISLDYPFVDVYFAVLSYSSDGPVSCPSCSDMIWNRFPRGQHHSTERQHRSEPTYLHCMSCQHRFGSQSGSRAEQRSRFGHLVLQSKHTGSCALWRCFWIGYGEMHELYDGVTVLKVSGNNTSLTAQLSIRALSQLSNIVPKETDYEGDKGRHKPSVPRYGGLQTTRWRLSPRPESQEHDHATTAADDRASSCIK